MSAGELFATLLLGFGPGLALGWALGARGATSLRRDHERRKAELRSHVLPLLEQRAIASGVPGEQRAKDEADALLASIALGRAIQAAEVGRDLAFTDTLEISQEELTASGRRQRRSG
jgi:hypothetical protein